MRTRVWSLALLRGLRIWCHLELWCRSQMRLRSHVAVAVVVPRLAPIQPLAWELPHVVGVAIKSKKKKKKRIQQQPLCSMLTGHSFPGGNDQKGLRWHQEHSMGTGRAFKPLFPSSVPGCPRTASTHTCPSEQVRNGLCFLEGLKSSYDLDSNL